MNFLASAGHAEYLPTLPESAMVEVWPPDEDELDMWALDESDLHDAFVSRVGEEPDPDWDLMWEHIFRFMVTEEQLLATVEDLFNNCVSVEPGGDDDTFDYWPSGVRLTMTLAERAGGPWPERVATGARTTIDSTGFEDELLDKMGLGEESQ